MVVLLVQLCKCKGKVYKFFLAFVLVGGLISSMNMPSEIALSVMVTETVGKISFCWGNNSGDDIRAEYSIFIFSCSPDRFCCLNDVKKDRIYVIDSRQITLYERNITDVIVSIDQNEEIRVVTNKLCFYLGGVANKYMNCPSSERFV